MIRSVTRTQQRCGLSAVETVLILGVIAIAVIIGAAFLGGPTATNIQDTADGVGDPAQLKQYFDDMGGGSPPPSDN